MSRTASKYTLDIRQLLDSNPELTHADARPMLAKLGHEIAVEPPEKSEAYLQFEQVAGICPTLKVSKFMKNEKAVAKTLKTCRFDDKAQKLVLREAQIRAKFEDESNNYNVTKYNWSKAKQSGTPSVSVKPDSGKNTKAKTAAVTARRTGTVLPVPKHRRNSQPVVSTGNDDALDIVKRAGGVAAAQTRIAELRSEAETLEAAVNTVVALQQRIAEAA
jgi:hypothetical protein